MRKDYWLQKVLKKQNKWFTPTPYNIMSESYNYGCHSHAAGISSGRCSLELKLHENYRANRCTSKIQEAKNWHYQ